MTQKIQNEIDAEKDRISRIEALTDAMPPHQIKRLEEVKHQGELALARCFGHDLHPDVAKRIVDNLTLNPSVLCTIGGGTNELPISASAWDEFMKDAANAEPLAKASIDHSNAALKEKIRNEELAKMKGPVKMAMARARTLDAHLEDLVKARLEARRSQL